MKKLLPALVITTMIASCMKTGSFSSSGNTDNPRLQPHSVTDLATPLTGSTISFSGYTWNVRNTGTATQGPGPNYWNGNNVWVDANGWLHLKAAYNSTTKHWECAEVWSQSSFGYGKYQWWVEGRIDILDKNVVLGLFNYSGNDGFDEMDIEFARWGNASYPNLNYTVWPATGTSGLSPYSNTSNFSLCCGTYSTHRFTRSASSVVFKGLYGFYNDDTNLFKTATCSAPPNSVSTLSMPVHMNLWFFQGHAPTNGQNVEVIIHSFTFTP